MDFLKFGKKYGLAGKNLKGSNNVFYQIFFFLGLSQLPVNQAMNMIFFVLTKVLAASSQYIKIPGPFLPTTPLFKMN